MIAVFLTLSRFKKLYQENYANNHKNTYKWILQITILFLVGNCFTILRTFFPSLPNINLLISVFALSVISWFVLKALYQPSNSIQVTVIATNATLADAYASTFSVMGIENCKQKIRTIYNLEVLLVERSKTNSNQWNSDNFEQSLIKN